MVAVPQYRVVPISEVVQAVVAVLGVREETVVVVELVVIAVIELRAVTEGEMRVVEAVLEVRVLAVKVLELVVVVVLPVDDVL